MTLEREKTQVVKDKINVDVEYEKKKTTFFYLSNIFPFKKLVGFRGWEGKRGRVGYLAIKSAAYEQK